MTRVAPLIKLAVVGLLVSGTMGPVPNALAESMGETESNLTASEGDTSSKSDEMIGSESFDAPKAAPKKVEKKQKIEKANSFVAGSDWEFDGFVAGGQDSAIKSFYYNGDTIYLNVGSQQGFNSGDRINIFKRGDKIKDPQTGRFLGFEVRLAAIAQVTDRIEANTCSVRIIKSNEAVEIGDLSKRIE